MSESKRLITSTILLTAGMIFFTYWIAQNFKPDLAPEHFATPAHIHRDVEKSGNPVMDQMIHMDSHWYLDIAVHGYKMQEGQANVVFFPLYPILVKALHSLTGWSWILSAHVMAKLLTFTAALTLAFLIFSYWPESSLPKDQKLSVTLICILAFLIYPMGFFLQLVYAEGICLTLSSALLIALRRQSLFWVFTTSMFLAVTRPQGLFFPVGLGLWDGIQTLRERRIIIKPTTLAAILGAVAGISAFGVYLHLNTGDALSFWTKRKQWDHSGSFWNILMVFYPQITQSQLIAYGILYLGLYGCYLLYKEKQGDLAIICLLLLIMPLQKGNLGDSIRYSLSAIYAYIPFYLRINKKPFLASLLLATSAVLYGVYWLRWLGHAWVG